MYDYGDDAVGFATISEVIDDFRSQSEGDWHYREDWHSLTPGDMSTTPVEFTDERGWTYLAVHSSNGTTRGSSAIMRAVHRPDRSA